MDVEEGIGVTAFLIDDRPVVFVQDADANRRFLEGIDTGYWDYQATVHGKEVVEGDAEHRHRAAAALRIAYGQGLETFFALTAALVQAPKYPLGWMMSYQKELKSIVQKIQNGRKELLSPLQRKPSWDSVADAVFEFCPGHVRADASRNFARVWRRFAGEFLEASFEPEYNSLKHGMRAHVGDFSVAMGEESIFGQGASPENMKTIGGTEYGSTFWMRPRKVQDFQRTFELGKQVSRAWVPEQFIFGLQLIGLSIRNVASRARIEAGVDSAKVQFQWVSEETVYDSPRRKRPSLSHLTMGQTVDLSGWEEPSEEEIRQAYRKVGDEP